MENKNIVLPLIYNNYDIEVANSNLKQLISKIIKDSQSFYNIFIVSDKEFDQKIDSKTAGDNFKIHNSTIKDADTQNKLISSGFKQIDSGAVFILDLSSDVFTQMFKDIYDRHEGVDVLLLKPRSKNIFKNIVEYGVNMFYDLWVAIIGLRKDTKVLNMFQFFSTGAVSFILQNNDKNPYLRNFDVWQGMNTRVVEIKDCNTKTNHVTVTNYNDKNRVLHLWGLFTGVIGTILTIIISPMFLNITPYIIFLIIFIFLIISSTSNITKNMLYYKIDKS